MRVAIKTVAPLLLLSTVGCGLLPPVRSLAGKIADGTYTAPDGDFSVALPFTDSYELTYMATKEIPSPDEVYVSFGPAAFDKSIYRLLVVRQQVTTLPEGGLRGLAHRIAAALGEQLRPMTGEPLVISGEGPASVGGSPAYRLDHTQHAPAGTGGTAPDTILHESYTIHRDGRLYGIWVQRYSDAPPPATAAKSLGILEFADSVQFGAR